MQNKTFHNFINKLLTEGKINVSLVGNSIKDSGDFTTLINGGFIEHIPVASGGGSYFLKDEKALAKYFADKFPTLLSNNNTAIANIHSLRNTKAGKRESQNVILLRGYKKIIINGIDVDLNSYTVKFETFSAVLKELCTDKICLVENLDSYLLADQVLGNDYVFVHTYGGMGKSTISKFIAKEILIFPDYDFKGLDNYLLVKSIFPETELFIPKNYNILFEKKSRTIKTRQGREQQPSKRVLESVDEVVVKIRTDIFKHKRFLEQQALFKND